MFIYIYLEYFWKLFFIGGHGFLPIKLKMIGYGVLKLQLIILIIENNAFMLKSTI
jgi:hypothetical protein